MKTAREQLGHEGLGQPGKLGDLLFQHLLVDLQLLDLGSVPLPEFPHLLTGVHFPEFTQVHWHDHTWSLGGTIILLDDSLRFYNTTHTLPPLKSTAKDFKTCI